MLNEYELFQLMKLRQEEIERSSRYAWKHFTTPEKKKKHKNSSISSQITNNPCCIDA